MSIADLHPDEFHSYYDRYISRLADTVEPGTGFISGASAVRKFFSSIPAAKLTHRYAADKWSIKEILQHLMN